MEYSDMDMNALNREEERLRDKYKTIEEDCLKKGLSFEDFQKAAHEEAEGLYLISKYKRLLQDPIVEYGKEWKGDLLTMEAFKKMVNANMLTDYDGFGYYATETSKSDVQVYPSDVLENLIRDDFSHVMWFNK